MLHRIQRWLTVFCLGWMGITSLAVVAQEVAEPEGRIVVQAFRRNIAYVAPGTDGTTTDIFVLETLDQLGLIDHDNDPTTPRVLEEGSYEVTNVTNTPGVNEIDPQFSWDGSLIVYRQETVPDIFSLFVVESDGENPVQLTPNGVNANYTIAFSPDGTQVAFSAQWGSSQYKIYRSDLDGENQFTLTSGEGFNAAFPLWRVNASGTEEITYIRAEGGASQIVGINPLTAEVLWTTDSQSQQWILRQFAAQYATFIQRENSDADWELGIINLDTREVTQITDNTTNDCCVVWATDDRLAAWYMEGVLLTGGTLLNPPSEGDWTLVAENSTSGETAPLIEFTTSDSCLAAWYMEGVPLTGGTLLNPPSEGGWTLVAENSDTGETVPLNENATNALCAVWSVDGTITTDWTLVAQNSGSGETVQLTETTTSDFCVTWNEQAELAVFAQNSSSGETVQLSETEIDNFCAVWSVDGTITTDMTALGSSPAYYLSDTEDGGRDIYRVNIDGSNPDNITANDGLEYLSITPLYDNTLLVGYNGIEADRTVPRLGFMTWNISDREFVGDYELLFLTNGSDPDVVDPISLEQLERMAAGGQLRACAFSYVVGEEREYANEVYSEPSENAPVVRLLVPGEPVLVNGVLPGGLSITADWLHLTDGTWVKATDLVPPDDCPALPTINRYTL